MSTRFDCPFLARMLEKFITQTINLFVGSVGCSVILVAGNWVLLQIEKWQNYYRVLDLFCLDIFAKPRAKMTTVLRFSRQNDVGLRALNVALWENLVLVVVLGLQSKALYWFGGDYLFTVKFAQWNLFRAHIGLFVKLGIENERETGLEKREGNKLLIKCPVVLALEY